MNIDEALAYLYKRLPMFQRVGAPALKPDLSNTFRLLEGMGNPHLKLKYVHVAGTNGKGTSSHALASILTASGYKTGLYTSPHLRRFNERIRIDGIEVNDAYVADFVTRHQTLINTVEPSFFEVTFVMSIQYFYDSRVDIAVIETGLGGRLDSTNVIIPEVALITMIGYDHKDLLGDTLQKIAKEKAGIIKPMIPVVIGARQPETVDVFEKQSTKLAAPLIQAQDEVTVLKRIFQSDSQRFDLKVHGFGKWEALSTDVLAEYFLQNIPGIISVVLQLQELGYRVSETTVRKGLEQVCSLSGLKGRWQVLSRHPLTVADVSHNEPGIRLLMGQVGRTGIDNLHLVIGMVKDKDVLRILNLLPDQARYYYTEAKVPRALPRAELAEYGLSLSRPGETFPDVNLAIAAARKNATPDDLVLVCGSTFVVAEIEDL